MLNWSSIIDCPGQLVVISDALDSPGEYILHDLVSSNAKTKDTFCILVSLNETFDHWKTIALRRSPPTNLTNVVTDGKLDFINGELAGSDTDEDNLSTIYERIRAGLARRGLGKGPQARGIVILDGISTLLWSGFPFLKFRHFLRATCGISRKYDATLVIRLHRAIPSDYDEHLQYVLQICSLHVELLPLSSGRSGAVSGQIALHHGPMANETIVAAICRSRAIQYRLADSGVVYFERGTGAGVL